jgi:Ca2+-binding EF-hand superfamily protein
MVDELQRKVASRYHDYREMFRSMDLKKTGHLDVKDFEASTQGIELDLTHKELESLFSHVDMNRDGRVDFGEFCDVFNPRKYPLPASLNPSDIAKNSVSKFYDRLSEHQHKTKTACDNSTKLRNAIRVYDPCGSGLISRREFALIVGSSDKGLGLGMDEHELNQVMHAVDPTHNGKIRYRELLRELQQPDVKNANSDGYETRHPRRQIEHLQQWSQAAPTPELYQDERDFEQTPPHFRSTTPYTSMYMSEHTDDAGRVKLEASRHVAKAAVQVESRQRNSPPPELTPPNPGQRPPPVPTVRKGPAPAAAGEYNHSDQEVVATSRSGHGVETARVYDNAIRLLAGRIDGDAIPVKHSSTRSGRGLKDEPRNRRRDERTPTSRVQEMSAGTGRLAAATPPEALVVALQQEAQRRAAAAAASAAAADRAAVKSERGPARPREGGRDSTRYVLNMLGRAVPEWTYGEGTHEADRESSL